jgi:hypothetical protein
MHLQIKQDSNYYHLTRNKITTTAPELPIANAERQTQKRLTSPGLHRYQEDG